MEYNEELQAQYQREVDLNLNPTTYYLCNLKQLIVISLKSIIPSLQDISLKGLL